MTSDELKKYIGKQIRYYRKIKKLTQKELATRIQQCSPELTIKENTISNYEKGIINPSLLSLYTIANVLETNINDFFQWIINDIVTSNKEYLIITL